MGKFAAYLNAGLALAWLALFFTNDAVFVSHETDLSDHLRGDAFAMAWAGSAICSRLYIALVNYGVELRYATAIFCIPSLAVGVLAALATSSFTSLAWAMVLLDFTNMHDTKTYNVYRDDYTPHGHAVCASLAQFGGPPCPTRAEGVRIACNRVREEFRKNPPRRNKRCVPMTGKQRCELVPGGCTN